jgi:DNA-binding YbaB/EbfC family protein
MKDIGNLMKQAQGMQQKLQDAQAKLAETTVEGAAGSGLVTLAMKGSGELTDVRISEDVFKDGDADTLADLILAAHADAKGKLNAASKALMQQAMGPLAGLAGEIPGLKF